MEEPAQILVGNGLVITREASTPLVENGCVAVRGGAIAAVGSTAELRRLNPGSDFLDARGGIIMPGLINTHTHLYSTLARGMALDTPAPRDFVEILERLWWRLDKALTLDDVYWSAMAGLADSIRNGVTTIFDHHASPGAVRGSLGRIADAVLMAGVRSCLCYEVSDRDGEQVAADGIAENREFLAGMVRAGGNGLRGLFGMHASFTLSDQTLSRCREAAAESGAGFHVHTAEAASDTEDCLKRYNKRIVERWRDAGILGKSTIAAHCVHVGEAEVDLLAESGTNVVHNPESNMGNAVGSARVIEMMARGVRVGLGTDGYSADMLESMKVANLLQKHRTGDPGAGWAEPPQMLFEANAAMASESFGISVGKLVPGAAADMVILDYQPPTPVLPTNIDGHMLFGLAGRAVNTSIAGGQILMRDRELLTIDSAEMAAKARNAAQNLWRRI